MSDGVVDRTLRIFTDLLRGMVHDRRSIVDGYGVQPAAADRYMRRLKRVPGVEAFRDGRLLRVRFVVAKLPARKPAKKTRRRKGKR